MKSELNLNNELAETWYSACEADHQLSKALYIIRNNLDKPVSEGALHYIDECRNYLDQTIMDIRKIQNALKKEEE